jgi:hypothetical protein
MRARLLLVPVLLLALAVPAGLAAVRAAGTLAVEDGIGRVVVKGQGTLVARLDRGDVVIVDLTPNDQWSPRVNGVPRGKVVSLRGRDVNVFIPGGRYRITMRGEGIALSARGAGVAELRARPLLRSLPGTYAVGDDRPRVLPDETLTVAFGTPDKGEDE